MYSLITESEIKLEDTGAKRLTSEGDE